MRPILRPRHPSSEQNSLTPEALLRAAIASRTCVTATYNRGKVKLAPYALYERDDALFLDAVTIERDGRPPREPKVGSFRLAGLVNLSSTKDRFEPQPELPAASAKTGLRLLAQLS